jgi:hypothetical protein
MRDYHLRCNWSMAVRIASRLATRTGVPRLAWINRHGRIHILYQRIPDPDCHIVSFGNPTPKIDWNKGEIVSCYKM